MNKKHRILFVCLGNICRSPAADAVMRKMAADRGLADDFEIDSAGTYSGHKGSLPSDEMRRVGASRGYVLDHRARPFRADDFARFDMIMVMDGANYADVIRQAPDRAAKEKISYLARYCRRFDVGSVPDPYGESMAVFSRVFDIIEDACGGLMDSITGQE